MSSPILYETHMHTPLCKHAWGPPSEYAAQAQRRGLKGIVVTCHGPLPDGISHNVRMSPAQLEEYLALVEQTRGEWADRVDVRLGLESDYLPEFEEWLQELHARADFDYILGSVHPQLPYYKERHPDVEARATFQGYYDQLVRAAQSGLFDCLAHPDLVKNEHPHAWDARALLDVIRPALDSIADTGVAMELNTSGLHKQVREMNPGPVILAEMAARRIPVVIGADAHVAHRVGAGYAEALTLLREAGYEQVSVFLERRRVDVPLEEALASLPVGQVA